MRRQGRERRATVAEEGGIVRPPASVAALCLLVLILLAVGALSQRDNAVLPADRPAPPAFPAEVYAGGSAYRVGSAGELEYVLRLHAPGDEARVDGWSTHLVAETGGMSLAILLLSALAYWAVAAFALAPRLARPGIKDLFAGLLLTALAIAIGGVSPPHGEAGSWHHRVDTGLALLWLVAIAFVPTCFVRFAAAYPRPLPVRQRHGAFLAALFAVSALLALWNVVAWQACFDAPGGTGFDATVAPTTALSLALPAGMLTGLILLWTSGRGISRPREKRQVRWILWAVAIGATPYVFLRQLPRLLVQAGLDSAAVFESIPPTFDRVIELTIPIGFAIAVVKELFLDIDVIIRRSVLSLVLGATVAGLLFGSSLLLTWPLTEGLGVPTGAVWAGAGVLAGLAFPRLRRVVGTWVDRTFFGIRFDHAQSLEALRRLVARASGQAELARRLDSFLGAVLAPSAHGVLVRTEEGWEAAGTLGPAALELAPTLVAARDPEVAPVARPDATACPDHEPASFPVALQELGVDVYQAVWREGRLVALVLLGPRRTGRHYLRQDLLLLEAAGAEAGATLERIELVQRVASETVRRRALDELTRQKSDLFARLAHDLRTPITAIRWTTQNFLEGVLGGLDERQARRLQDLDAAAAQVGRLVDNLSDLGRLDLHAPLAPPAPLDLGALTRETARALGALAAERGVDFQVEAPEDLPRVAGLAGPVRQILLNLLDNALKHAPPGSAIEVRAREDGDREVAVSVRDHGPGLPPALRDHLFELFRQGDEEADARRRGFGIGLYIVKAWADALGGSVVADDHPEGGARFTVRLQRWLEAEGTRCTAES